MERQSGENGQSVAGMRDALERFIDASCRDQCIGGSDGWNNVFHHLHIKKWTNTVVGCVPILTRLSHL